MLQGGIYDQAGGGFARYSVDEYWFVPHFEKMMYDNGQLISLYSNAYALTDVHEYKKIAIETIEWIQREMTSPEGMFYSSLDADSEGIEGKFYCFTKEEIEAIVTERSDIFCDYFSIEPEGNWEHSNILYVSTSVKELSIKYGLDDVEINRIIQQGKKALMKVRKNRIRPGLDDKALTSWNALTITGMLKASQSFHHPEAFNMAVKNLGFILENMKMTNGLFYRNYKNGKTTIHGFLDDQALMIEALIEAYKITWDENYLLEAKKTLELTIEHYYDTTAGGFFYTAKDQHQPVLKTKEVTDNVIPSANAVMANVLFTLGHYFYNDEWIQLSKQLCNHVKDKAIKHGPYFSHWTYAMLLHNTGGVEVAITGNINNEDLKKLYLIPGLILMHKKDQNSSLPLLKDKPINEQLHIYICKDKTCGLPVSTINKAIQEINSLIKV